MDATIEIKSRLPIEELVRQYTQLQKKGRNFVGLCPFHHDSHPSFLVSPDKGICYCFPCQKGGDIFSFYQLIEGVDFRTALKDLAERTGVVIADMPQDIVKKDEKERLRDCLEAAQQLYAKQLQQSDSSKKYLQDRGITPEEIAQFGLGFAPDSFSFTYDLLLKAGFSRKEIVGCGIGIQKDLADEKIYDRFRNRLMFPIHDIQARIVGFGGRTLGNDDAKYLNTSENPLYHKAAVLYGLHVARDAIREKKNVILVEGYFDVLACHRAGVHNVVATCGTALTEEHVRLLKRYADSVSLCLDQDKAGRDAAERGFLLCSREGLQVYGIVLDQKDPADTALESIETLRAMLTSPARPYFSIVCEQIRSSDLASHTARHAALQRLLPLLHAIPSATEREAAVIEAGAALGTTGSALEEDLRRFEHESKLIRKKEEATETSGAADLFSSAELTLGLLLSYPRHINIIEELIPPEEEFAATLYAALRKAMEAREITIHALSLDGPALQRTGVLLLYCEEQGFSGWSDSIATREIRRNCANANKDVLRKKQQEITRKLVEAHKSGNAAEQADLQAQYQEILKLSRMAFSS